MIEIATDKKIKVGHVKRKDVNVNMSLKRIGIVTNVMKDVQWKGRRTAERA